MGQSLPDVHCLVLFGDNYPGRFCLVVCGANSTEPLTAKVEQHYCSGALKKTFRLLTGVKQGPKKKWFENGQRREEVTFVNGKEEGLFQQLHENGQLEEEVTFVNKC